MLIEHDFDWDPEAPGSISNPSVQPSSGEPGTPVVIIERRRGFSYGILALAIVALALSAGSRLSKTRPLAREPVSERARIQTLSQVIDALRPPSRRAGGLQRHDQ
jgi:hypothetical protein